MGRDHIEPANFTSNSEDVQHYLQNMRKDLEAQQKFNEEEKDYEKTKLQESTATQETRRARLVRLARTLYYIGLVIMFGIGLDMYVNNEDSSNRKRTGLILWVFPIADRSLYLLLKICGCRGNKK